MASEPTDFHVPPEPGVEFEPIPIDRPIGPDAVNCCVCRGGEVTWCGIEDGTGSFMTSFSAQSFAYWYS